MLSGRKESLASNTLAFRRGPEGAPQGLLVGDPGSGGVLSGSSILSVVFCSLGGVLFFRWRSVV